LKIDPAGQFARAEGDGEVAVIGSFCRAFTLR
jgi:hypothetical protein